MIIPQTEINLVNRGTRTAMLLPVERGDHGERLPCPHEAGELLRLAPKQFVKGTQATVSAVERILLPDARAELHHRAFLLGDPAGHYPDGVWVVRFVLGDLHEEYEKHTEKYLSRKGAGLTTDPAKAVSGEGAVPSTDDMKAAAAHALKLQAANRTELQQRVRRMELELAGMRELGSPEEQKHMQFIERRLKALDRTLDVAA